MALCGQSITHNRQHFALSRFLQDLGCKRSGRGHKRGQCPCGPGCAVLLPGKNFWTATRIYAPSLIFVSAEPLLALAPRAASATGEALPSQPGFRSVLSFRVSWLPLFGLALKGTQRKHLGVFFFVGYPPFLGHWSASPLISTLCPEAQLISPMSLALPFLILTASVFDRTSNILRVVIFPVFGIHGS